jgi:hypothetical protein
MRARSRDDVAEQKEIVPQCIYCMHWAQGVCTAYPGGVPYVILMNKVDHREPYPLDRHIHFQAYSGEADSKQRAILAGRNVAGKPRRRFPFFRQKG